jgi:hypothetical protein
MESPAFGGVFFLLWDGWGAENFQSIRTKFFERILLYRTAYLGPSIFLQQMPMKRQNKQQCFEISDQPPYPVAARPKQGKL